MSDQLFGPEAGPPNPAFNHVQQAPERRPAAPGPAGAGDIRSQHGAGGLAVLAQDAAAGGPDAVVSPAATTPGGGAVAESPAASGVGVHFSGQTAVQGLTSSQVPTGAPAGFAGTSGPALTGGGNTIGVGHNPFLNPNAVTAQPPGGRAPGVVPT